MSQTYALGLTFIAPSEGDTSWASVEDAKHIRISQHDHTGGGMGTQIGTSALAADSVNATKIRLGNNTALRARNALDNADINLLKLDTTNVLNLQQVARLSSTESLSASGAISVATNITLLTGASSLSMTLAAGVEGQIKWIVYTGTSSATITPASTTGANTIYIGPYGSVQLVYLGSEWRAISGSRGHIVDDTEAFGAAGTWSGVSKHVVATGTTYTITTPAGYEGQTVMFSNQASGAVTFGGTSRATGTYWLYSYLNAGWRAVQLT